MIVLDEQLAESQIIRSIKTRYKGKVTRIQDARPQTRITDDVIPANSAYCVICFKLTSERSFEISDALRATLSRPEWHTKRKRLGKVILVSDQRVAHYSSRQRQIHLASR